MPKDKRVKTPKNRHRPYNTPHSSYPAGSTNRRASSSSDLQEEKAEKVKLLIAKKIIGYCFSTLDKPKARYPPSRTSSQRKRDISKTCKNLEKYVWKTNYKPKLFNDSIHKTIVLEPVEVAIIQTPEFFRLKNIKQLGGTCHVYPGAVHTRFEHSIGVCHLAGEFVKKLKQKYPKKISEDNELCVRIAGLCHDLGHGPFSHLFEKVKDEVLNGKNAYLKVGDKTTKILEHEEMSILIFKWILVKHLDVLIAFVNCGLKVEHVKKIANMIAPDKDYMKGKVKKGDEFLFEIVANKSSGLDVDKWDYYSRDCHHLGLTNEFDYWRTLELCRIVKPKKTARSSKPTELHIGFMKKEIHNIFRMFRTRSVLYQKACMHPVVGAIEMMISDIIFEARDQKIFRGQSLKSILEKSVVQEVVNRDLELFCTLTDSILDIIYNADLQHTEAPHTLTKLMMRDLYWCCYNEPFTGQCKKTLDKERDTKKKKLKSTIEKKKDLLGGEIRKISYASEISPNPLQDVYFFDEEVSKQDYPGGDKLSEEDLEKTISKLHIPKAYAEFQVRGYCKKTLEMNERNHLEDWMENEMKKK